MKIVFLGTPEFAKNILASVVEQTHHKVLAVVCQPDKPANRGQVIPCAVKQYALSKNIPVLQYNRVSKEGLEDIKALKPDVMITAAFGQILKQNLLDIALTINVHPSLLPKYRGATPLQWAILNGDKVTGVTVMKTEAGIDCGDILLQKQINVLPNETAGELFNRITPLSCKCLIEALEKIENGTVTYTPQEHDKATFVPMLKKEMGKLDFQKTAAELRNLIYGFNPWPGAFCMLHEKLLKVHTAEVASFDKTALTGTVVVAGAKEGIIVACGQNTFLRFLDVQPEGSRRMTAKEFANGNKIKTGDML